MNAIKRVISGDDMQQSNAITTTITAEQPATTTAEEEMALGTVVNSRSPALAPALVENDMDEMDMDMDTYIDLMDMHDAAEDYHIASGSETPRSSLSDCSAAERMEDVTANEDAFAQQQQQQQQQHQHQPLQEQNRTMHRSNREQQTMRHLTSLDRSSSDESVGKTASSQNSSRDWGWFEDDHASEGALMGFAMGEGGGSNQNNNINTNNSGKRPKEYETSPHHSQPNYSNKRKNASQLTAQSLRNETLQPLVQRDPETDAAAMAVTAPNYVLEESMSNQKLWKYTAGQRPPQPLEERAFFEKMWAQNFVRSQVEYQMPVEVLTATTPISLSPFADGNFNSTHTTDYVTNFNTLASPPTSDYNDNAATKNSHVAEAALVRKMQQEQGAPNMDCAETAERIGHDHAEALVKRNNTTTTSDGIILTVMVKGDNVFGTTVSKSFARPSKKGGPIVGVDTVNISVASYRVVESKKHGKYAQFLVIYREGSIRDTIGVWKRYSDFQELSRKVTHAHEGCATAIANMSPLAVTEEHEVEHLPNAITSWQLLKKRQRWYRCLDAGYLSLKVFLLERFLHDILFESSSPNLLRDFVGAAEPAPLYRS